MGTIAVHGARRACPRCSDCPSPFCLSPSCLSHDTSDRYRVRRRVARGKTHGGRTLSSRRVSSARVVPMVAGGLQRRGRRFVRAWSTFSHSLPRPDDATFPGVSVAHPHRRAAMSRHRGPCARGGGARRPTGRGPTPRLRRLRDGRQEEGRHGCLRQEGQQGSRNSHRPAPGRRLGRPATHPGLRQQGRRGAGACVHRHDRLPHSHRCLLDPAEAAPPPLQHLFQRADALHAAPHLVGHRAARRRVARLSGLARLHPAAVWLRGRAVGHDQARHARGGGAG